MAPMASEVSVTPSCIAAMKCAGSLVIFITARAGRLPSSMSSLSRGRRTVTSEYSAATKKPFRRIRTATPKSSRKTVMPRSPGRRYWREVRPLLRGSIGDAGDVPVRLQLVTFRRAVPDQSLEVGERLRDGKPARRRPQIVTEQRERHFIGRARLGADGGSGDEQTLGVMGDQLVGPADRVGDRVAVTAVGNRGSQVDRALQRSEVVPERIGPARRPESDRRRD